MSISEKIGLLMKEKDYEPMYKEELAIYFNLDRKDLKDFYKILEGMEKDGLVFKNDEGKYQRLKNNGYMIEGKFSQALKGFGFVIPTNSDYDDIFIERDYVNGAMHGDKVLVNILKKASSVDRAEGEIYKVLERKNTRIVGTYEDNKSYGFVIPLNQKIMYDFFVKRDNINGARPKQKVVLEVTKWPKGNKNPEGRIVEILGYPNEKGTDILSVVREKDIPDVFSPETLKYAKGLGTDVSGRELEGRVDLTDITTFTIDGADAKDFDDAVSIERLKDGKYRLGVHIADVSNYVKPGTPIDRDAYERGNSVYLLSKVVPMLPEELSNGLCSLKENELRLTLSILMDVDYDGNVVAYDLVKGYIKSRKRLIYDEISDFLETGLSEKDYINNLSEPLRNMEELYRILRDKREKRGSIDFEFPETIIELDEDDRPINIKRFDRRVANRLIEEFMLLANETIAERYEKLQIPFVYRVHEDPDEEKLLSLGSIIYGLGYANNLKDDVEPKDLQELIEDVKDTKDEHLVKTLVLRSLKKARYAEDCLGHFGLSVEYYTHFTSPIRRYSDLLIHRIIVEHMEGELGKKKREKYEKSIPKIAEHISATERRAEDAERDVDSMKIAEYMSQYVGHVFEGTISYITSFGIYVELENTAEGLVKYDSMDDYYIFNEDHMSCAGEKTGKVYRVGDRISVKLENVSISRREIDFSIEESGVI